MSASGTNAIKIAVGSAAAGRLAVNANPTLIPALGGSSLISATIFDINGNALGGVPVSFATTAGSLDSVGRDHRCIGHGNDDASHVFDGDGHSDRWGHFVGHHAAGDRSLRRPAQPRAP